MYATTSFKKSLCLAFLTCMVCHVSGQEKYNEEIPLPAIFLQSFYADLEIPSNNLSSEVDDQTQILQIGQLNEVSAITGKSNGSLSLVQNGNDNHTIIDISTENLIYKSLQNGNGNLLMDYGKAHSLSVERHILQEGNNHNIVIHGSNSITKNLKIMVQGDAETVTIRNFN